MYVPVDRSMESWRTHRVSMTRVFRRRLIESWHVVLSETVFVTTGRQK